MTQLYPAMLRLGGKRCVVIGGGRVATRKVLPLLESGAEVAVIAPTVEPRLEDLASSGRVRLERRPYRRGDLAGATLAFSATDSRTVNAAVADEAGELGIPVNVADDPTASTFHVPAVSRPHGLTIALSTGGRSPAFARRLRQEIEELLTPERIALLELYAELRAALADEAQPGQTADWSAADEQVLRLLREGRRGEARHLLRKQVLASSGSRG